MVDRLILCLDGTWNSPFKKVERQDGTKVLKPSNPLKVARAVLPVDSHGNRQITYYDSGVGALGLYPGLSNRLLKFADNKLGGGWGAGFEANVEQAANFLANNMTPGAEIYIFGFSRGAAQARALTRFLDWLGGITPKSDAYYMPLFFREYILSRGKANPKDLISQSSGYQPFLRLQPFSITFLGVWDTVMALGSRFQASENNSTKERSFHVDAIPASCVKHARQALAIDEKRYDFRPEIWEESISNQTLAQRWFPGCHGNIGGSYGNDGLANGALHWIVEEAKKQGLQIDDNFLKRYRPYSRDEISDTYTDVYSIMEFVRRKHGKGIRALSLIPNRNQLTIDKSTIERLCSDPENHKHMNKKYRSKGVVDYAKKHKNDKDKFIRSFNLDPNIFPFPEDI